VSIRTQRISKLVVVRLENLIVSMLAVEKFPHCFEDEKTKSDLSVLCRLPPIIPDHKKQFDT
jgi:hypothetical protein